MGELQGKSRLSPESAESSTQWDPYLVLIFKLVHLFKNQMKIHQCLGKILLHILDWPHLLWSEL